MIRQATQDDLEEIRAMLREYAEWLKVDLCFQNFEQELAGLPGCYAPPRGRLLIEEGAGCIALRPLEEDVCEMKRLFVRPGHRGSGLGRRLVVAVLEEARAMGYRKIRLDTLPQMGDAQRLYGALGFYDIPAYCQNPVAGARFMEKEL